MSRATLQRYAKAPFCRSSGFSHTLMDIDDLTITMGPFTAKHCVTALEVKSTFSLNQIAFGSVMHHWIPSFRTQTTARAIWFEPPEETGAPLSLNARFYGHAGNALAWIENNIWHGSAQNFDIVIATGKERSKIRVQGADTDMALNIEFFPPKLIKIYNFLSYYNGEKIEIGEDQDGLRNPLISSDAWVAPIRADCVAVPAHVGLEDGFDVTWSRRQSA